jgi:hypothetical protein
MTDEGGRGVFLETILPIFQTPQRSAPPTKR